MSSEVAIHASGLGKCFSIYDRPYDRLVEMLVRKSRAHEFWALRGVDFEIRKGETVGVIGRNGSGKSTLLQMICGTLQPTEGEIQVRGRVAALLELGAGFNPEFTGRENIFLNASVLGLTRAETEQRLQSILDFAGIGEFVDQPVRTYSSGMYVRLAFAVAISIDPDILVVDEALSVGDEVFQRKCFSRIEELKRGGATILFVSHSAGAILQLCDRAILLDRGERLLTGAPKLVVGMYQRLAYAPDHQRDLILEEIRVCDSDDAKANTALEAENGIGPQIALVEENDVSSTERYDPGLKPSSTLHYVSRGAHIEDPSLQNSRGRVVNILSAGHLYTYTYRVHFEQDASNVHFGMMIKSINGIELAGMSSHAEGDAIEFVPRGTTMRVEFHFRALMLPGTYFLNAGCVGIVDGDGEIFLHRLLDAAMFRIELQATDRRRSGFFDLSEEPACLWERIEISNAISAP